MSSFLTETPLKSVNQLNNQNSDTEEQYFNENLLKRKIEFDKGNPLSYHYSSNEVTSVLYTFHGYRRFMWSKVFSSPFNLTLIFVSLFYILAYLSTPKDVQSLYLSHSITFYFLLLLIEFILSTWEYIAIYKRDLAIDNQPARIYRYAKKKFIHSLWKDIRVGNIIKVKKDEIVPADVVILETLDPNHVCSVDYSALNGVFDSFEIKKACNDTFAPVMKTIRFNEYVKSIKGSLKYEDPNANTAQFFGKLKLESLPRASEVNEENFVMRGSTIKNFKWIYGLVVYTGMDTKIMQALINPISLASSSKSKNIVKRDRDIIKVTLKFIQYFFISMYVTILVLMIGKLVHNSLLSYFSFLSSKGDDHNYLEYESEDHQAESRQYCFFYEMYLAFLKYLLTFLFSLPFNWFGMIRIVYALLSKFIQWDVKVLISPRNGVEIINSSSIADFGQIRHILTDKTGTLTKKKFSLKIISINAKMYSFDLLNRKDENSVMRSTSEDIKELELYQEIKCTSPQSKHMREFAEYLCLCHTVKIASNDTTGQDKFNNDKTLSSSFAEERAILKTMDKFGYSVKRTKHSQISIQIHNESKVYEIVGVNEYSDERRRMSVVVKHSSDEPTSLLLCKANDFSVFQLCLKGVNDNEIAKTKLQIREMVRYGLRFFIICKRQLNVEDTSAYVNKFKSAENYVVKSEDYLFNLAMEYEKDMEFLGVLFFEEKQAENLKYSINKLNSNGIKVWVVSGDRKENVISVGKSLDIYNPKAIKGDFSDKDKPEDLDIKMNMLLMQYLFPNEKINKMRTKKGAKAEAQYFKGSSKDLTLIISGECFTRICNDERNFQSLATLLSYCSNLLAYSFSPNNKQELCKMIMRYVSKNTKVLAVGDGLNDYNMLKKADVSIGIRSNEVDLIKNSCDIIVDEFAQIVDVILVHGTWNFQKLFSIALLSLYANLLVVLPLFLHQNACPIGSTFYVNNSLKIGLDLLVINFSIISLISFDMPVERSILGINTSLYKENFFDKRKLIFAFGFEFIKGVADSLILYYLFFILECVNERGETIDQSILGCEILYTAYTLIFFKILLLQLKAVSYVHCFIMVAAISALTGISFIDLEIKIATHQGMSYVIIVLNAYLILSLCFLYEFVGYTIANTLSHDFIVQISQLFNHIIETNMHFRDFASTFLLLTTNMPEIMSKIDKISYPEVLSKITRRNKNLHPCLESMADVTNEEVALLKIKTPLLQYYDKKIEEDFFVYRKANPIVFICYLVAMGLIWVADICLEGFPTNQLGSKVTTLIMLILGVIVYFSPLFQYKKVVLVHYFLVITVEIICVYAERTNNDVKICFKPFSVVCFPLFFPIFHFAVIFFGAFIYLIGLIPSIYLNDFGFSAKKNLPFFLYSNLPLCYHRNVFLCAVVALMMFVSYYSELECRVEFLKYYKCEAELRKDNLIMASLIPEFVREKLKNERRDAVSVYELVSVLFCEICDFDTLVNNLTPKELIRLLDELYSLFDQFCLVRGLQKIESVGKAYVAAGGFEDCELEADASMVAQHHSLRCFEFGMDILNLVQKMLLTSGEKLKVRIGIHQGEVVPAIVGNHKPQFILIGDTVNTSARLCSYASENCINCSQFAYEEIKVKYKDFIMTTKDVKGKGRMNLYLFNPKPEKKVNLFRPKRPKQSSGNLIMKSFTKKCPVLTKQPTKTSVRAGKSSQGNNYSVYSNKKSSVDYSNRIVDISAEGLIDGKKQEMEPSPRGLNKRASIIQEKRIEKELEKKTNDFLANSFLFLSFKTNLAKNGFLRYEKQKFNSSENLSISMNVCFLLNILLGVYQFSQYSFISTREIAIYVVIKAVLLIILVGIIYQTKFVIQTHGEALRWLNFALFLCFTIVIQIQMNFVDEEFLVNLAIEEVLTTLTITMNGMLDYKQNAFNLALHIGLFVINICVNYKTYLMVKYCVFLIITAIICFLLLFMRYYYATFDFIANQKKARNLAETEKMLFNMMPLHVVQNLKDDTPVADVLDGVTILIADIVGFTEFFECHKPPEMVQLLSELFKAFDDATKECAVYKVHTMGTTYVIMGFNGKVPMNERNYYEEARNVCKMADIMLKIMRSVRKGVEFDKLDMRISIHTGIVIAGIIGSAVVRYDVFGTDVQIASKIKASGASGRINISEDTKKLLEMKEMPFKLTFNQTVKVPGISREVKCYFMDTPPHE